MMTAGTLVLKVAQGESAYNPVGGLYPICKPFSHKEDL
jgi:hypothetical protein